MEMKAQHGFALFISGWSLLMLLWSKHEHFKHREKWSYISTTRTMQESLRFDTLSWGCSFGWILHARIKDPWRIKLVGFTFMSYVFFFFFGKNWTPPLAAASYSFSSWDKFFMLLLQQISSCNLKRNEYIAHFCMLGVVVWFVFKFLMYFLENFETNYMLECSETLHQLFVMLKCTDSFELNFSTFL